MIYSQEILLSDIGSPLTFVFPEEANVYKYELEYIPKLCENFPIQIRISQSLYNSTSVLRLDMRDKFRLVNSFYLSKSKLSDGYYYATSNVTIGTNHNFVWFELYSGDELLADTTIPYTDNVIFWELNPTFNDPIKTLSYSKSKNGLNVVFNESLSLIYIPSRNSKLLSAKVMINKTGGSGGGTTPIITDQWTQFVCERSISGLISNVIGISFYENTINVACPYSVDSDINVIVLYRSHNGESNTSPILIPKGHYSETITISLETQGDYIDDASIDSIDPLMDSKYYYSDKTDTVSINTGYARYYYLTLSNGVNYSALNAFGSYLSITDNELKNISLYDYTDRMNAFCLYVENLVSGLTISRSYREINLTSCPI